MKKDRKNNKLFQLLAKYYQKQADIYSEMAGLNGTSEHKWKRKILLLVILLVIVLGGVAAVVSGIGKNANKTDTQSDMIEMPDFEVFSNGYAKLKKENARDDSYVQMQYQVQCGMGEMMEEYHELLTSNYSYRLLQHAATRDINNQLVSEYYYVYMGEENVSKFMIESGEESFALQLLVKATIAEDNSGVVEIKTVHEIQKKNNQEKTSFVPDVLLTPDLQLFANGYGISLGTVAQEDHSMTTYEFDADAVEFIVGEYRSALESGYPYQFMGEKEQESKDGWITKEYYYRYRGEESVPEFYANIEEDSVAVQLRIAVLTKKGNEKALVHFSSLEQTVWQEHGEQTTYVPLKITSVTLNCWDLLYKNGKSEPLEGVPVGYDIKYSVVATSTGTKTKKLTHSLVSSDENVVNKNYDNLTIEALSPGTATITANVFECSTEKEFTVYPVNRANGQRLKLSLSSIEINSLDKFSVTITATMMQIEGYNNIIPLSCAADTRCTWGEWVKVADKTYSLDFTYEIDPAKFHQESNKGLVFVQVKTDKDGNFNFNSDILDYQVVEFVWDVQE